jgi:serine/threonine protein kinase
LNQKGIIHRDIKPQNVLINKHTVKLTDFGFAKSLENTEDLHSTFCGSPLYMSPEILRRQSYSAQSDLWSLGVLLYELLVKEHPYLVHTTQQLMQLVENGYPIQYESIRSTYYRAIVAKLLEPNVERRISADQFFRYLRSNEDFLEELEEIDNEKHSVKAIIEEIKEDKPDHSIPITSPVIPKAVFSFANASTSSSPPNPANSTCLSIMKETPPKISSVPPLKIPVRKMSDTSVTTSPHNHLYKPDITLPPSSPSMTPSMSPQLFPCSAPTFPSAIEQHIVDNYVEEREKMSETMYIMPVYGSSPTLRSNNGLSTILTKSVRSLSAVWNMSPLSGLSSNFKL